MQGTPKRLNRRGDMRIEISIAGRYKNRQNVKELFDLYAIRIRRTMKILSREYEVQLPDSILLRPLYVKKGYNPFNGYAQWTRLNGWAIIMNIELCIGMKDKGLWVIDHECVHIAKAIVSGSIRHGKAFEKMYAACRRNEYT